VWDIVCTRSRLPCELWLVCVGLAYLMASCLQHSVVPTRATGWRLGGVGQKGQAWSPSLASLWPRQRRRKRRPHPRPYHPSSFLQAKGQMWERSREAPASCPKCQRRPHPCHHVLAGCSARGMAPLALACLLVTCLCEEGVQPCSCWLRW
jgi:hypothetical protein